MKRYETRIIAVALMLILFSCALPSGAQPWQFVGPEDISSGDANPSIVIDKFGSPYVLFGASVFKYSSGSWAPVGAPEFDPYGYNENIALDSNGTPYVFFASGAGYTGIVVKFNGTTWDTVGSGSLTDTICCTNSIAIGPDNTPYIAFPGSATDSGKIKVMKFDGSN